MVQSMAKPSEIQIIKLVDDLKQGKTRVSYAFNYGIQEKQIEEHIMREDGTTDVEMRTVYEYYQFGIMKTIVQEQNFVMLMSGIL